MKKAIIILVSLVTVAFIVYIYYCSDKNYVIRKEVTEAISLEYCGQYSVDTSELKQMIRVKADTPLTFVFQVRNTSVIKKYCEVNFGILFPDINLDDDKYTIVSVGREISELSYCKYYTSENVNMLEDHEAYITFKEDVIESTIFVYQMKEDYLMTNWKVSLLYDDGEKVYFDKWIYDLNDRQ